MRFRFSLRLFLILFTLLAVALGAAANFYYGVKLEIRRHDAALERLEKLDVSVWENPGYDSPEYMSSVKSLARRWIDERAFPVAGSLHLPPMCRAAGCDEILEAARDLSGLYQLTLTAERLSPKTVALLAQLRELTSLHILFDSIDPEAVDEFARLKSLQHLTIGAPVTEDVVRAMTRLPELKYLTLDVSGLSPQAISALKRFPNLRQVTITGRVESPEVLEAFARNPTLFRLALAKCQVNLESLASLSDAKSIAIINIWDECDAPVDVLKAVAKTPNLKILTLARNVDSPRFDVSPLTQSKSIEEIHVGSIRLSGEEVQALLSIPQIDKLSFSYGWSVEGLIHFLQEEAKLRLLVRDPKARPVFEWSVKHFRLDGSVLCRVNFAGERE